MRRAALAAPVRAHPVRAYSRDAHRPDAVRFRHRFGRAGYLGPYWAWPYGGWPYEGTYPNETVMEPRQEPPRPVVVGIPSLADLPAVAGIPNAPASEPAIYVLDGTSRSTGRASRTGAERRSGPKVVIEGEVVGPRADAPRSDTGPRIIHLDVPRGR